MTTDLPSYEERRLSCLAKFRLLDTEPEESFDQLTKLASQHFQVPIALVTLVDDRCIRFKSNLGLSLREVEREFAFCAYTIEADHVLVVDDASQDPRFQENPLVTLFPFARFYAGAPLIVEEGIRVGAFAILDLKPRVFSEGDLETLQGFAKLTVNLIHHRTASLHIPKPIQAASFHKTLLDWLGREGLFAVPDTAK